MTDVDDVKGVVLEEAKQNDVKFIKLQFTDIAGMIKSVLIPVGQLEESLDKGTWFDGSSIEGFARICESDMYLKPDSSTFAILPWRPREKATARIIADVYGPDGKPFEGDPRYILKRAVEKAEKAGFIYNTGPELEFFLFKMDNSKVMPVPHDVAGYFDFSPRDLASDVRRDIILALEDLGMHVEISHHEVAPGQHEIDFRYGEALRTADNAVTFKYTVKAIANIHDLYATFMPKPIFGQNGSGMHVHQSLFNKEGVNVFFDSGDKYNLSETAYGFIAGQLEHVRAMSAVLSPTVNSYKRLVPGYEAPVYVCWGQRNRSALIRVPRYSLGRENSTRAELRCPDPSCNPYLAFAVMLRAGLEGIKKKMIPPKPVEEDVYGFDDAKLASWGIDTLPASLDEAIQEFGRDKLMKDTLGRHTYERYLEAKKAEWDEYRIQVTDWEIDRYLGIF
ncbi:MAG: glutamine synthetase family protein [Candidatus Altiarchaeota archaeon]|nr:glutamine synthetase family protein [Candidatus Altiarchaeota archaeon]